MSQPARTQLSLLLFLRRWEDSLSSEAQIKTLVIEPRTSRYVQDLQRRTQAMAKLMDSGKQPDLGLVKARVESLQNLLQADLGFELVTKGRGRSTGALTAELARPLTDRAALQRLSDELKKPSWSEPNRTEVVQATMLALRADEAKVECCTELLASLALQTGRGDRLRRRPRAACATALWHAAFNTTDELAKRRLSDKSRVRAILEVLMDDDRVAHLGVYADGRASLPHALRTYAATGWPLADVANDLANGNLRIASASDITGARHIAARYAWRCVVNVLYWRANIYAHKPSALPVELLLSTHEILESHGWLPALPARQEPCVQDLAVFLASLQACVWLGADAAASAASEQLSESDAMKLATLLAKSAVDGPLSFLRRDLRRQMNDILGPSVDVAARALVESARTGVDEPLLSKYAGHWATALGTRVADDSAIASIASCVDIETTGAVEAAANAAFEPPQRYFVTWTVLGLSPSAEPWTIEDVTFLDPDRYQLGFEQQRSQDSDASASVCRVKVPAATSREVAVVEARSKLEAVLDLLVFAFSVNEHRRGFRPRVSQSFSVEAADTDEWSSESPTHRSNASEPIKGSEASVLMAAYRALISRSPTKGTDLERRFVDAVGWYRRARWETDVTRRVLGLWIILESFFAEKKKAKSATAALAASLHLTWRDLPGLSMTRRMRQWLVNHVASVPALVERVDASGKFAGWKHDDRVLFELTHARDFVALLGPSCGAGELPRLFLSHIEALWHDQDALKRELLTRRWSREILLQEVYVLRNKIVHEAHQLDQHFEGLAAELERIVEGCLMKAADAVVGRTAGNVGDLIRQCSLPW